MVHKNRRRTPLKNTLSGRAERVLEESSLADQMPRARPAKPGKDRLDQVLVDRGFADSKMRAQALIMAGLVIVGDRRVDKPGSKVFTDAALLLKGRDHPWVSRGGVKLVKGLDHFAIDPTAAVCLDIGASTGGFTDVLLHRGAKKVYAVDVGYGQLAHKLRVDARVVVMERTNARHLTREQIAEPLDVLVCDASFIGLRSVLEKPLALVRAGGRVVALLKPQFEVGKDRVGKKGVVRDTALHAEVCQTMSNWLENVPGWRVEGVTESPIKGPEGNIEFLLSATKNAATPSRLA